MNTRHLKNLIWSCWPFLLLLCGCHSSEKSKCQRDSDCGANQVCTAEGRCLPGDNPDGSTLEPNDEEVSGGDAGSDVGVDQGPPPCQHDVDCPPNQVCDIGSGDCIAGVACQYDYNCYEVNQGFCDPTGKVCKRRSALCEPCAIDRQCPDPGEGDKCISYAEGRYCGQRCGVMACPAGYECDPNAGSGVGPNPGQCRSGTGICANIFVCKQDGDCAGDKVCNTKTGVCQKKCVDDSLCASGWVCHYTGRCGPSCSNDNECGQGLICCSPGRGYCGPDSQGRCHPEGCVLHRECLAGSGNSLGYCDKRTNTCKTGCRAADWSSINDCKSGMTCNCNNRTVSCDGFDCCPDPGEQGSCRCDPEQQSCAAVAVCDDGVCEATSCVGRQDVSVACGRHQLCCGWPSDGYSCPQGTQTGDCYVAPKPVWCASCPEEGQVCETPDMGHGEKGICLKDEAGTSCHVACRTAQDCPSTWECDYSFFQGCDDQNPCGTTGRCEIIGTDAEENPIRGCVCSTDDDCPSDLNGFPGRCAEQTICNPTCQAGKICKFAKVCQCQDCCKEL